VLYARVSKPNKARQTVSVDQQLDLLRDRAEREQWVVVAEQTDRARSASRYATRAREAWPAVMMLIAAGEVDRLALFEYSRASRDRMVHAALFAACEASGVVINIDGRDYDPNDPSDALALDIQSLLAVNESAQTSKRVRRDSEARAREGKLATSLPYGYRTIYATGPDGRPVKRHEEHPGEAPVVREVVARLLDREPAEGIAKDLTARGILTRTGKAWRSWTVSAMALRPTYAGLRVHHGDVLRDDDGAPVKGQWPELISEADHYSLTERYGSPDRDKYRNVKTAKFLGTGIYRCGRPGCDGRMRLVGPRAPHGPSSYSCAACFRVSRRTDAVDEWVSDVMIARLGAPDVLDVWYAPEQDAERDAAALDVARLTAKLEAARTAFLDDDGDPDAAARRLAGVERQIQTRLNAARKRAQRPATQVPTVLAEAAGARAGKWWASAPVGARRAVTDLLATVTLLPGRPGRRPFDPDSVIIEWRSA
jgi:DNA invertase Pin-like site-specific DNA recombinase